MTGSVLESSLLGRSVRAHASLGDVNELFASQTERLARSEHAGEEFDRLADKVGPADPNEFAGRLLLIVQMAAIDASMVGPPGATPTMVKRQAAIKARYKKLLRAVDVLDGLFGVPEFEFLKLEPNNGNHDVGAVSDDPTPEETSIAIAGGTLSDDPILRSAISAWKATLGLGMPRSNDSSYFRLLQYQVQDAPAALTRIRLFLLGKKAAELEALHMGTLSRRTDGEAQVRTFVVLLDRRLDEAFRVRDVGFVTSMANALFATGHLENHCDVIGKIRRDVGKAREFHEDSVRKILERVAQRQVRHQAGITRKSKSSRSPRPKS